MDASMDAGMDVVTQTDAGSDAPRADATMDTSSDGPAQDSSLPDASRDASPRDVVDFMCPMPCASTEVCTSSRTCVAVEAARALWPTAFAIVPTQRPLLRWRAGASSTQSRIEICRDAACTDIVAITDVSHAAGAVVTASPDTDISTDGARRFWRILAGTMGGFLRAAPTRAIFPFAVGSSRTELRSVVMGYASDYNSDGRSDLVASASTATATIPSSTGGLYSFNSPGVGAGFVSAAPTLAYVMSDARMWTERGATFFNMRAIGDANNDGFGDMFAAFHSSDVAGIVDVLRGSSTGLTETGAQRFFGPSPGAYAIVPTPIGDLNGDGYADLIVSAFGDGATQKGRQLVHLGSAAGFSATADATLRAPMTTDSMAGAVALGDVDGDGFQDLAVGFGQSNSARKGVVFYRGQSAPPYFVSESELLMGAGAPAELGVGLALLGDVDGDGLLDLAMRSRPNAAIALLTQTAARSLSFRMVRELTPPVAGTVRFGANIVAAGDVNADGYSDFLVSADGTTGLDSIGNYAAVFLYLGSATFATTTPTSITIEAPVMDRANAALSNGSFGVSLSGMLDFDGDGVHEFAIGAPQAGAMGSSFAGYVYLYSFDRMAAGADRVVLRQRLEIASSYVRPVNSRTQFGASVAQ